MVHNADYAINKEFPKGTYTTEIPNARQCLKPGVTGMVLLYGTEAAAGSEVTATTTTTEPEKKCEKFGTDSIIITAVITFLATLAASFLIFRKKK